MKHVDPRTLQPGFVVAWMREPFGEHVQWQWRTERMSVADLVKAIGPRKLPVGFAKRGKVHINGTEVPRRMWKRVTIEISRSDKICVTLSAAAGRGGSGGGGGGKQVIQVVAAIALLVAVTLISSGTLTPFSSVLLTKVLAGAVALAGALAISALTPPPVTPPTRGDAEQQDRSASAAGNVMDPDGPLSAVIGTHKIFPKFGAQPLIDIVGEDEVVEALYVQEGPVDWDDIRIAGAPIGQISDLQYEIKEGWPSDTPQTLIQRYGHTEAPQIELSSHQTRSSNENFLTEGGDPDQYLPKWHPLAPRPSPDEIWLHTYLSGGLQDSDVTNSYIGVPFRIRMRLRGEATWLHLPEVHLADRETKILRKAIILKWGAPPIPVPAPPASAGWIRAYVEVPGQSAAPATAGWTAHASFGSGIPALGQAGSAVTNVALYSDRAEIFLNETDFPKGHYDVEIIRGAAYTVSSLSGTTYQYGGQIRDLFTYVTNGANEEIVRTRKNVRDRVDLVRMVSLKNETPTPKPGLATLSIRAKRGRLDQTSSLTSRYVRDWDGSGWNNWTLTSNPAPHFVEALTGWPNADPLPLDLLDNTGLVAWRQDCIDNDYTSDALFEGRSIRDVCNVLASNGYARPYQSEVWGVIRDRDRSGDEIVQTFSPRNVANFRIDIAYPNVPDGLRVEYLDADRDFQVDYVYVWRPGKEDQYTGRLERITYQGLTDRAKVIKRATFDLAQPTSRGRFYSWDASAQAIRCRRGDLVVVQHRALDQHAGYARVKKKITSGGNVTALRLDSKVPLVTEPDWIQPTGWLNMTGWIDEGSKTGLMVNLKDGTSIVEPVAGAGTDADLVSFVTPFADPGDDLGPGCHVVSGRQGIEAHRFVVHSMTPRPKMKFGLTAVDEAPELFA